MQVAIPFGKGRQTVEIPDQNFLGVALPPAVGEGRQADQLEIIRQSLANPIGSPCLRDMAHTGQKVTVVVSDHTRPTPTALIMTALMEELSAAGISPANVTVIFATGMHRVTKPEEMQRILGLDLYGKVKAVSHDCNRDDEMKFIGTTRRGTPILVNRLVADADLKIAIGTIEPHQSAGWSGGAKSIMPGVSSKKSIMIHHSRRDERLIMLGDVDNNPFREEIEEIAAQVGVDFICNVVLNRKREVIAAFAGHILAAHRRGVDFARRLMEVSVAGQPDIVIAGCGGFPRDSDFWQVEGKIISRVWNAVRDGGILILVADCSEGFGNQAFEEYLQNSPAEIISRYEEETFSVPGFKAYKIARLLQRAQIYAVFSPVGLEKLQSLSFSFFTSLSDALDAAWQELGRQAKVLAVPDATSVLLNIS